MSAATSRDKAPPADRESPWATRIPVFVIILAFVGSIFVIASARREETPPGTTATIRIGHWQLEGGVRTGIDDMIAEYRKIHPEVNIVQDAIPEGTFATWLTTQLMGGTAPDILEIGQVQYPVMIGYLKRYFLPLSELAIVPNPYNKGTDLEDVPWSATFRDGMRSGYYEEIGEYMGAPLSQFGSSLFCNMSLLKELTGRDESPTDLREFLEVCEEIKRHKDAQGHPYVPIASSNYHWGMWDGILFDPATFGAVPFADFTHEGYVGVDELFIGIKNGMIDFDFPGFRAKFKLIDQMVGNFQTGLTGLPVRPGPRRLHLHRHLGRRRPRRTGLRTPRPRRQPRKTLRRGLPVPLARRPGLRRHLPRPRLSEALRRLPLRRDPLQQAPRNSI